MSKLQSKASDQANGMTFWIGTLEYRQDHRTQSDNTEQKYEMGFCENRASLVGGRDLRISDDRTIELLHSLQGCATLALASCPAFDVRRSAPSRQIFLCLLFTVIRHHAQHTAHSQGKLMTFQHMDISPHVLCSARLLFPRPSPRLRAFLGSLQGVDTQQRNLLMMLSLLVVAQVVISLR